MVHAMSTVLVGVVSLLGPCRSRSSRRSCPADHLTTTYIRADSLTERASVATQIEGKAEERRRRHAYVQSTNANAAR